MKKVILTTIAIIILLLAVGCGTERSWIMGDWPGYEGVEDLAESATDVVRARVLDERYEWVNTRLGPPDPESEIDPYDLCTIHRVLVLEVFQGDSSPGDIIEVIQLGGELDGEMWHSYDNVGFSIDDDLVFFIRASLREDNPGFWLLSPSQSVFNVLYSDKSIGDIENDIALESAKSGYSRFAISVGELVELAEVNFGYINSAWVDGELTIDIDAIISQFTDGEENPQRTYIWFILGAVGIAVVSGLGIWLFLKKRKSGV